VVHTENIYKPYILSIEYPEYPHSQFYSVYKHSRMGSYALTVRIGAKDLETLKQSKYNLCLAKKCNGVYTAVWASTEKYLENNDFSWVEEYQVYGVNKFRIGVEVRASTKIHEIEFGQTSEINDTGVLGAPTGNPDTSGKFSIANKYGDIAFGVGCKFEGEFLPFYVTPTIVRGTVEFQPIVVIQVWFSLKQKTGQMILSADSDTFEIKYKGETTDRCVDYNDGKWVLRR